MSKKVVITELANGYTISLYHQLPNGHEKIERLIAPTYGVGVELAKHFFFPDPDQEDLQQMGEDIAHIG